MNNLQKIRKSRGYTQFGLEKISGVSRALISLLETGDKKMTLKTATKLSAALRCNPYELLGGDAIKYSGGFLESLEALLDANMDFVIDDLMASNVDALTQHLYFTIFTIIKERLPLDDVKAIHAFTENIAKNKPFDIPKAGK